MDFNAEVFGRCAAASAGRLTRQGLQRAMAEAGITVSSHAEQRKLRHVQEEVIQQCRGDALLEDESTNPLTSPKGFWNLDEFLLMVAGMHHLTKRELWKEHETLASEF